MPRPVRMRAIEQTHPSAGGKLITLGAWRVHALGNPGVGSGLLRGNAAEGGGGNELTAGRV